MNRGIKWFAWLALAAGIGLMAAGVIQLIAPAGTMPSGLSCRAVCGLSLIAAELLGDQAGHWALAGLTYVLGMCLAAMGVKVIRKG